MFPYDTREVVRVKAKLISDDGTQHPHAKKFSLDPVITSYEMLQSLLAKAFEIRGDFTICYIAIDDEEKMVQLPLLNDWDLDAAILSSSDPNLKLVIQARPVDEMLDEEWDVIAPLDIPCMKADTESKKDGILDSISERLGSFSKLGRKPKPEEDKRKKAPMNDAEFRNFLDSCGRLVGVREFRESIYHGGIEPSLRKVAWRHLLCIYPEDMTGKERFEYLKRKSREYIDLRSAWKEEMKQGRITEEMRFTTSMVKKDVVRTDRTTAFFKGKEDNKNILSLFDLLVTYSLNHPEVSYCQGMSDLASPILAVQGDEAHAYVCFCALMQRLKSNFMFDGKAMTCKFEHLTLLLKHYDSEFYTYMQQNEVDDLFFTYRWLLLELKREFPFEDSLYMLEVMWSSLPPNPPVTELPLQECLALSSDSGPPQSPATVTGSGTSQGTSQGTPYTKLMAMRRSSSNQALLSCTCHEPGSTQAIPSLTRVNSTTSSSESSPSDRQSVMYSSINQELCSRADDIDQALMTDSATDTGEGPPDSTECTCDNSLLMNSVQDAHNFNACAIEQSRFYLSLQYSESGSPIYVCQENDETNQQDNGNTKREGSSISSVDSGIRSRPDSPSKSSRVSQELQFAFESSSPQKVMRTPIFPPPYEFGFGNPFLMFAATTMILQHRDFIMKNKMDFNDIVMLYNKGVRKNDVHKILHRTKLLYEDYVRAEKEQDYSSDLDLSISV